MAPAHGQTPEAESKSLASQIKMIKSLPPIVAAGKYKEAASFLSDWWATMKRMVEADNSNQPALEKALMSAIAQFIADLEAVPRKRDRTAHLRHARGIQRVLDSLGGAAISGHMICRMSMANVCAEDYFFDDAARYGEEALKLAKEVEPPGEETIASIKIRLADIYKQAHNFPVA